MHTNYFVDHNYTNYSHRSGITGIVFNVHSIVTISSQLYRDNDPANCNGVQPT